MANMIELCNRTYEIPEGVTVETIKEYSERKGQDYSWLTCEVCSHPEGADLAAVYRFDAPPGLAKTWVSQGMMVCGDEHCMRLAALWYCGIDTF